MQGEFKVEVSFKNHVYILRGEATEALLAMLRGARLPEPMALLRDGLREALAGGPTLPPEEEDGQEDAEDEAGTLNVQRSTFNAQGGDTAPHDWPRCHACGGPGRRLPSEPGDTEALWVCDAPDCWRRGMPAARRFFETGIR
jgi:hypothetical protein